jgi:hypothetical protein
MTSTKHKRAALLGVVCCTYVLFFPKMARKPRDIYDIADLLPLNCSSVNPSIHPKLYGPAAASKMVPVNIEHMIFCLCTTMQCQLTPKCLVKMIPRRVSGSPKSMKTSSEDTSCSPVGLAIRNRKLHPTGDHIIYRKHKRNQSCLTLVCLRIFEHLSR